MSIIKTCPRDKQSKCNNTDPDYCCGGGAGVSCSCTSCHRSSKTLVDELAAEMDLNRNPLHIVSLMARAAEEIERLRAKLKPENREPPHCPSCACGLPVETTASIEWSEVLNPDAECSYTHLIGKTTFGRILATWKGWKDHFDITVDESPWGFMGYAGSSPEEAKRLIEARYNELLREAIGSAVKTSSPQRLASELRCIHSVSITQYCQRCADCNSHMDEGIRSICFGGDGIFAEKTPAPIRDMIQANLRGGPAAHDPAMAKAMDPPAELCPHGFPLADNVCGPCSEGRPNRRPEKATALFDRRRFENAPCYLCGYNGPGYFWPASHPCARQYHADEATGNAVPAEWFGKTRPVKSSDEYCVPGCVILGAHEICEVPISGASPNGER